MSYLQRNIFASIISTLLVFGIYYAWLFQMVQDGRFDGANGTSLLGQSVLLLIVAAIIVTIIATIIFNILFSIATNDLKPSTVVDERDRLIELRGMRISEIVTGGGFMLAMVALALGQAPFLAFNIIVLAFALASVTSGVLKLFLYRSGF